MSHWLYLLRCADDSLYTGIALDPVRRLEQHNCGKGSKYVASRRPAQIVYREGPFAEKGEALRRELQIKALSRTQKEKLIATLQGMSESSMFTNCSQSSSAAMADCGHELHDPAFPPASAAGSSASTSA